MNQKKMINLLKLLDNQLKNEDKNSYSRSIITEVISLLKECTHDKIYYCLKTGGNRCRKCKKLL